MALLRHIRHDEQDGRQARRAPAAPSAAPLSLLHAREPQSHERLQLPSRQRTAALPRHRNRRLTHAPPLRRPVSTHTHSRRCARSGGGTIRFKEELAHGANAGLDQAVAWLEPVHAKHADVSYADLYTLAGCVAVEAMGGPAVAWRAGRVDAMDPSAVTPDGRLPGADAGKPEATAAALRATFGRMGFDDREIVALSGAHALGRCHAENSGYVGPWQGTPTIFSNIYFKLLLKVNWTPDERTKKFQYKDPSGTLMMLPSDLVLIQDDKFKKYVEAYAKDKKLFYADFAAAFQKLEELGTKGLVATA